MEEYGIIEKKENNKMFIKLEGPPKGGCESCVIKGICSSKDEERILAIANDPKFNIGERIKIEVGESRAILFAFLLFIAPLLLFFAVYLAIQSLLNSFYGITGGIIILIAYFLLISHFEKSIFKLVKIKRISS